MIKQNTIYVFQSEFSGPWCNGSPETTTLSLLDYNQVKWCLEHYTFKSDLSLSSSALVLSQQSLKERSLIQADINSFHPN